MLSFTLCICLKGCLLHLLQISPGIDICGVGHFYAFRTAFRVHFEVEEFLRVVSGAHYELKVFLVGKVWHRGCVNA